MKVAMTTDTAIWLKDLRALQSSAEVICNMISGVTSLLRLEVMSFGGLEPCSYEGCYDYRHSHLAEGLKGSSADQPLSLEVTEV